MKKQVYSDMSYATMRPDAHRWWQLQQAIGAPHWRAAALGLKTPEQACGDFAVEVDAAIATAMAGAGEIG